MIADPRQRGQIGAGRPAGDQRAARSKPSALPLDDLKIDHSFVTDMQDDPAVLALIKSV